MGVCQRFHDSSWLSTAMSQYYLLQDNVQGQAVKAKQIRDSEFLDQPKTASFLRAFVHVVNSLIV
jgi:hypothetical protein